MPLMAPEKPPLGFRGQLTLRVSNAMTGTILYESPHTFQYVQNSKGERGWEMVGTVELPLSKRTLLAVSYVFIDGKQQTFTPKWYEGRIVIHGGSEDPDPLKVYPEASDV